MLYHINLKSVFLFGQIPVCSVKAHQKVSEGLIKNEITLSLQGICSLTSLNLAPLSGSLY